MNYHPEFIRRGDTLHEIKESADFSIRDMSNRYQCPLFTLIFRFELLSKTSGNKLYSKAQTFC